MLMALILITINFAMLRFSVSKYYLLEEILDIMVTSVIKESYFCKLSSIAELLRIGIMPIVLMLMVTTFTLIK